MRKLKVVSLFSGIGAFEKALTNIGVEFDVVGFSEINKYSIESYCALHGVSKDLSLGDVTQVDGTKLKHIDILTHGSPCTSYSSVNYHSKVKGGDEGSGTASSLMWETVRIVKESMPKVVIWENVRAVLNKTNKHNFDRYIQDLSDLGYTSSYSKMNSKDYGVAQNRPRVFVVSILDSNDVYSFPQTFDLNKGIGDYLDSNVDSKYIVPDKQLYSLANPDNSFIGRMEIKTLDTHAACLVTKGGRRARTNNFVYNDLSLYKDNPYDKKDINRMIEDGIKIRALTPLEFWRLQGFTDQDYEIAKKGINDNLHKGKDKADSQMYAQAGNSITVDIVERIFENLFAMNIFKDIKLKEAS